MLVGLFFVTTTSVKKISLLPVCSENTGNKSPCGNIIVGRFANPSTNPSSPKLDGKK